MRSYRSLYSLGNLHPHLIESAVGFDLVKNILTIVRKSVRHLSCKLATQTSTSAGNSAVFRLPQEVTCDDVLISVSLY